MPAVHDVATVRAAEEALMARLPEGALMQRAARGLARACSGLLRDLGSSVSGARIVCLVGSGNNGGDALWAGARLARRGARVTALTLSEHVHAEGAAALLAAGGRVRPAGDAARDSRDLRAADLVLDGIVGIGGAGGLRPPAAALVGLAEEGGAAIVAVDIPSGVSADSGEVADPDAVVRADLTVTFGCLKPGLLLWPGREQAGAIALVDIGLDETLPPARTFVLDDDEIAAAVPEPSGADYKYSRGVAGIAAGSGRYRGAGLLATGAARHGDAGMVQVLDRGDGVADSVVEEFWDVVVVPAVAAARATAWAAGPGLGEDDATLRVIVELIDAATPLVLDADALRLLADPRGPARTALARRSARGGLTVLTPHAGEFRGLGFPEPVDRAAAARSAAAELGCVVLLKGPGTVVAAPGGECFIDTRGGAVLGTAGSGDVLTGLLGALLAGAAARHRLDAVGVARIAAAAAGLHGLAGERAARGGRPVTARDILAALPGAIAAVRRGRIGATEEDR